MILSIAEDETNLDRYREALDVIVQTDPESFSQVSGRGVTLHLGENVLVIARLVSLFRSILDSDLDAIPKDLLPTLAKEIRRTEYELRRARELAAPNHSPEDITSSLQGTYHKAYTNLSPMLAHVGADPAGFEQLKRQAEAALDKIKNAAAEAASWEHAAIFGSAAKRHGRTKYIWLGASAILAATTLWLAWQMAGQVAERDLSDAIQFLAARIILFGVLSYALVSCVRTYRAEAHNHVVNSHRCNALRTFEMFTAASSDDATRNAVLMQATQCIFSHRPTGFGQREDDAAPQSQVLELTRNVLPTTSGQGP